MSDIGLKRGTVRLEPHNPAWHQLFITEAKQIQTLLHVPLESIQHVGSTAIPGVDAKPIIDIAILVSDLSIADQWSSKLAKLDIGIKALSLKCLIVDSLQKGLMTIVQFIYT